MADKPFDTKTFAQFLEEQQAPAETVTLAGYVARSPRQGSFVLNAGGQTLELPVEAVKSYKVMSEGPPKLVELEIVVSKSMRTGLAGQRYSERVNVSKAAQYRGLR